MKDVDGITAAEQILKHDPKARIIMVTALNQENLLKKAIKLGVKDFIVKPFEPGRLIEAIKKAAA